MSAKSDSTLIWDIISGAIGYRAVFVSYELGLFELLNQQPSTLKEVCQHLNIDERPAEALLSTCLSLQLVELDDHLFHLSKTTGKYLLKESETSFGALFDMITQNPFSTSVDSLKKAVLTNKAQTYGGDDIFQSHQEQVEQAKAFTRGMHSISVEPASIWPQCINLSSHRHLLDIGGGSGAHAIGALSHWPELTATVFDLEPVCAVAHEYIAHNQLEKRMSSLSGDIWSSDFPLADIHFYSQIFHDWPEDKCQFLAQKSFDSLTSGGKIIIHEILYDDDKSGPFMAAASSVAMLVWAEGKQYSGAEIISMLTESGFINPKVTSTSGYWSIISAEKP
ncbi:MAG: methyltransferase [Gammaproteobacteria bacterium]|nr:methyltransferase [Gammaproteobacteria bacterium]